MTLSLRAPVVLLALGLLACNAAPEPVIPEPPPATAVPAAAPTPASPAAAPTPASAPTSSAAAPAPPSYRVCHCCCGGVEAKKQCLYRSKGDSLEKIIAEDKKPKAKCPPNAGCTMPIEYVYCD